MRRWSRRSRGGACSPTAPPLSTTAPTRAYVSAPRDDGVTARRRSRREHRERLPPADRRRLRHCRPVRIDLPLGEPVKYLVERDPALEARERGTKTEVDAEAEREVLDHLTMDVEPIGIRILALVV